MLHVLVFFLTRCLAHSSCSWPTQWTMAKLWPSYARRHRVHPLHVQNWSSLNYLNMVAFIELMTHCKIKAVGQLQLLWIRMRGIYLWNDVQYIDAYIHTYIYINIAGDAVWPVWGPLRLAPIMLWQNCLYCSRWYKDILAEHHDIIQLIVFCLSSVWREIDSLSLKWINTRTASLTSWRVLGPIT